MLYLKVLAQELEDLSFKKEDGEALTEDENNRFNSLLKLSKDLGISIMSDLDSVDLIEEREAEDYFSNLAIETGLVDNNHPLFDYIDWETYAEDCLSNYSCVEFEGTTYYYNGN